MQNKKKRALGRLSRAFNNIPHYSARFKTNRPINTPEKINYLTGMPVNLGMMLNDELGCCSISGLHHARQVWGYATTNTLKTDADKDVLTDYEKACGYDPSNPASDQGAVLQDVLAYAEKNGITTDNGVDKINGYFEIDPRIQSDIREIIAFSGIAYIGIDIPESWTQENAGGTWDKTDGPIAGGHCVILAGYDANGFNVISWGEEFFLTNAGFAQACKEAYGIIDSLWIEKNGFTPGGINENDLKSYLNAILYNSSY